MKLDMELVKAPTYKYRSLLVLQIEAPTHCK